MGVVCLDIYDAMKEALNRRTHELRLPGYPIGVWKISAAQVLRFSAFRWSGTFLVAWDSAQKEVQDAAYCRILVLGFFT